MMYKILNRWNEKVLWEGEADALWQVVQDAVSKRADLRDADLRDANLRGANLGGANLGGANLGGADLRDANLIPFRDDLWAVLSAAPSEVEGLLLAVREGKIDGSTYEGDCACLVGTIAKVRHCAYGAIPSLAPDSHRPAEQWFMGINPGDTPATNMRSQHAEAWIIEWLARMREAFGAMAVVK